MAVRFPPKVCAAQRRNSRSQARVRDDFRSRMQNPARRGGRDRGGRRDDRGRRPQHGHSGGHSHRPSAAPRRTQLIADMLKQGQEIIVQIAKEPLGKKGARITSHVALPGRFLVYMPTLDHTGVSRKIASAEERARLRHLVNDAKGTAGGGFIVRTAAASAAPEEVRADVEFLTRTWAEIKARSEQRKAPSLLHRDLNLVRAHSARLHHAGFRRDLGGFRRGIHQGCRLHEPLPAAAGEPREALHQGNAGFRRVRHPAGNRQGAAAEGVAEVGRLHRHQPHRSAGGDRREHRQVRRQGLEPAGRHDRAHEPGSGEGNRPADAAARSGRHHHHRLHRHGRAAQPREGDGGAGRRVAGRPRAVERCCASTNSA